MFIDILLEKSFVYHTSYTTKIVRKGLCILRRNRMRPQLLLSRKYHCQTTDPAYYINDHKKNSVTINQCDQETQKL